MEYRKLGRSGLKVSEVGLGSWLTYGSSVELAGTRACVEAALDCGINFFETADIYARGEAERLLGQALAGHRREALVLASKCFWPMSDDPNDRGLSRKHLFESCHASLRRLGVDYLDLFQCHRFDEDTPTEEVVRAMDDLARQGKILYWGVSCWTAAQVSEAVEIAGSSSAMLPISNQPAYNMLDREPEAEIFPECQKLGLGQVVFSPLGQGVLTGKYSGGRRPPGSRGADQQRGRFMERHLNEETLSRVDRVLVLGKELELSPAQLALSWCLRRSEVASVIIGATRPEQVRDNAGAAGVTLEADVVAQIDELLG